MFVDGYAAWAILYMCSISCRASGMVPSPVAGQLEPGAQVQVTAALTVQVGKCLHPVSASASLSAEAARLPGAMVPLTLASINNCTSSFHIYYIIILTCTS